MSTVLNAAVREATVAEVLLHAGAPLPTDRPALVVEDRSGALDAGLAVDGRPVFRWARHATTSVAGAVAPPPGPFAGALVRLPKDKDSLDFALHQVAAVLEPGAPVRVAGANDEGIKSVGERIAAVFRGAEAIEARAHCRVWEARRPAALPELRVGLPAWRRVTEVSLPGGPVSLVSYPGMFARGGLDEASEALIEVLPALPAGAALLDFGCGTGVLALAALQRQPRLQVQLLDADALAVEAARENVPGAQARNGASWGALPAHQRFDLIVSNPPIHRGRDRDLSVLERLLEGGTHRLAAGGALLLVVQRTIPIGRLGSEHYREVAALAETDGFQVWRLASPWPKGRVR